MTKRCACCRRTFVALHAAAKLCSADCRQRHRRRYQKSYREQRKLLKVC
jgi:hypothetical protein